MRNQRLIDLFNKLKQQTPRTSIPPVYHIFINNKLIGTSISGIVGSDIVTYLYYSLYHTTGCTSVLWKYIYDYKLDPQSKEAFRDQLVCRLLDNGILKIVRIL